MTDTTGHLEVSIPKPHWNQTLLEQSPQPFVNPTDFLAFLRDFGFCDFAMFRWSLVAAVAAVVASGLACEGDECDASSLLQTQDWPKHCNHGTNHIPHKTMHFFSTIANFAGPGWYHSKIKRLMAMGKSHQVLLSICFFHFFSIWIFLVPQV